MKRVRDDGQYRRYLLGAATDAEREAIERACFERADGVDAVSAAEDELIDDYLSGRLERDERERFERHYLSSPGHRTRVAVLRAMTSAAAATPAVKERTSGLAWWAAAGLAAGLIVVVVSAVWSVSSRIEPAGAPADTTAAPAAPSAAAPRVDVPRDSAPGRRPPGPGPRPAEPTVIALTISPILARGSDEPARITVARGTDTVRLVLLGEPDEQDPGRGRAIVRTVAGREVWQGSVVRDARPTRGAPARVDVPAALLPPDDYIVQLLGTDSTGMEVERYRYFFSVRAP